MKCLIRVARNVHIFVATFIIALSLSSCFRRDSPWYDSLIHLPDKTGFLIVSARPTHLYLAEYEYKIQVKRVNARTIELPLVEQTGGLTHIVITWYPPKDDTGPYLRFKQMGRRWDEIVDLKAGKKYVNGEDDDVFAAITSRKGVKLGHICNYLDFHPDRNTLNSR